MMAMMMTLTMLLFNFYGLYGLYKIAWSTSHGLNLRGLLQPTTPEQISVSHCTGAGLAYTPRTLTTATLSESGFGVQLRGARHLNNFKVFHKSHA